MVLPRTLKSPMKEDVFDLPWTELSGSSPEQLLSRDNLSSTISQEMQDLLSSIQSLGKTGSEESQDELLTQSNDTKNESKNNNKREKSKEKSVDFENLMKEVEDQIRFSATAELLDRIAKCPAIENSPITNLLETREDHPVNMLLTKENPSENRTLTAENVNVPKSIPRKTSPPSSLELR